MAFAGFGKNSGPSVAPRGPNPFDTPFTSPPNPNPSPIPNPSPNPNPTTPNHNPNLDRNTPVAASRSLVWQRPQVSPPKPERPSISPNWGNQPKQPVNFPSTTIHKRISPVATKATVYDAGHNFPTNMTSAHAAKRARSPPPSSLEDDILGLYNPSSGAKRNDVFPPKGGSRRNSPGNAADPAAYQSLFIGNSFSEPPGHQRSNIIESSFAAHGTVTPSPPRPDYSTAPKRGRSPPLQASNTSSVLLDTEREMQAKAKRLARFNIELSQPLESLNDHARHNFSGNKQSPAPLAQKKNANHNAEKALDIAAMNPLSDDKGLGSSTIVVGLCPDMCPELEREERERKGDLDKFERLDGERHQTSKFLAIKKYNRTAEREADLIRPLPVLQNTVDYLLNLLDQAYGENFLGIYNFLWDRMRAIRMDLRMQHIFNQEAIVMLEQMIRLHIVAMHELCEYKKGEGFSEGFDAHLNIEQMNKTSVELFQMYEDHRKKGNCVPTEKEFRGYYALLKLDKHPGYKVEPAELSLDLAKMTPEMRCTPEILFTRDVARACRFGNYIAFFRLARKASYLQACLMHAHFAKLRTQALACLHSGLPNNNQGRIPISHVVTWLGMEGEDVESLLEYHGFSLRRYDDEMYMVKEGPFLNSDTEFPTHCSRLVHLKRSRTIIDDVKSCPTFSELTEKRKFGTVAIDTVDQRISPSKTEAWANMDDDEMFEYKTDSAPRTVMQSRQLYEGPALTIQNRETDQKIGEGSFPTWNINNHETEASVAIWNKARDHEMAVVSFECATPLTDESVSDEEKHVDKEPTVGFPGQVGFTFMNGPASPKPDKCMIVQAGVTASTSFDSVVVNSIPQRVVENLFLENETSMLVSHQKDEAFKEKLKVLIRKWKKRSSMLKEIREQKELLTNAALSSLSLGPPIRRQTEILKQPGNASGEVNIDFVARERYTRQRTSWARLNVSELVAPILSARNPVAKCLCWKIILLVQENGTENQTYNLASRWLVSKLMGTGMRNDELVVSLPDISIWKKCTGTQFSLSRTCCLSVIRETRLDDNQSNFGEDIVAGSSCFLFLVSNSIPWEIQKLRLRKVLAATPSGSSLPLLILSSDSCNRDTADPSVTIMSRLGIHEADETRISSSSVAFLSGSSDSGHANGFFDDNLLRESLLWLANHLPIQPTVHLVKIREMVSSYLRHSTEALEHLEATEVTPDHCISAFNEALDHAAEEIVVAASANTNNWPSPELDLLDKSSDDRLIADMNLPSIGWSSAARINPIVNSIKGCSLPDFPNDMPWLSNDFPRVMEIQNQKLAIEECLSNYLTRLLDADLASREASIMLQQGAGLESRGSCHHIVPRWLAIFQRIYNWQLMRLTGKGISEAYALDQMETMDLQRDSRFEDSRPQTRLSLDELVEIRCNLFPEEQPVYFSPESNYKVGFATEADIDRWEESGGDHLRGSNFSADVSSAVDISEQSQVSCMLETNRSRLDILYKQCSLLQDKIDRELAIFF